MNRKIDFLILGAQKTGSTSLYNYLRHHKNIFLPEIKEVPFFANDKFYSQGLTYLKPYYQGSRNEKMIGGAYVNNIYFSKKVSSRVSDYNPQMKLIAVLRNPVDRAYSAFWFAKQQGWELSDTFEEAIINESKYVNGSYEEQANLTYIDHGMYFRQLKDYLRYFSNESIKIVLTEDLKRDTKGQVFGVLDFLGLDRSIDDDKFSIKYNTSAKPKVPLLNDLILRKNFLKGAYQALIPEDFRFFINKKVIKKIQSFNKKYNQYPPMNPKTRKELIGIYEEDIVQLEKTFNLALSDWRK